MWGLAARCSKANKQDRLVERKVCCILDAGNCKEWMVDVCPKAVPTTNKQGRRAFIDGVGVGIGERGYMQKQHSQLRQLSWNWSSVVRPASSCSRYS